MKLLPIFTPAHNAHIAKIAALPRVIKKGVFCGLARVDKVLGSSNFGNETHEERRKRVLASLEK